MGVLARTLQVDWTDAAAFSCNWECWSQSFKNKGRIATISGAAENGTDMLGRQLAAHAPGDRGHYA